MLKECKHLDPVMEELAKSYPTLKNKYFCSIKLKDHKKNLDKKYHDFLCPFLPGQFKDCHYYEC